MKNRFLSLFLAFCLLISLIPAVQAESHAAASGDLEALIAEQFDAFAKSLHRPGASEAATQLVTHSIKGGGKLTMDADDDFTGAIMNTQLLRTAFIQTAQAVHDASVSLFNGQTAYMRGFCMWYQNHSDYFFHAYQDNGNDNINDDEQLSPSFSVTINSYDGSINSYDEAMMLVTGSTRVWFTFQPVFISDTTIRYRVTIQTSDTFDFTQTHGYQGDDRGLETFLTWLGRLLSLGLLTTFDWSATAELELELPNLCPHRTNNYRWNFDGEADLVSLSDDMNTLNPLQKITGYMDEGTRFRSTSYVAQIPIALRHDYPWVLEYRCKGYGYFALADSNVSSSGTYLRKTYKNLFFGESVLLDEDDPAHTTTYYGIDISSPESSCNSRYRTYTLRNEVYEDGSNMIYLYVDGVNFGPMNQYHLRDEDGGSVSQNTTIDWVVGKDFFYQFIGTHSCTIDLIHIDYIQVWENGEGIGSLSLISTSTQSATCTTEGGTRNVCALCGADFLTDVIPATGHDFGQWETVKDPSCTDEGRQERACRTCGQVENRPVAVIPHTYTPTVTAPTCTEQGFTTFLCDCGDRYTDAYTEALGHDWSVWQTVAAAGCTEPGLEERLCARCGHREERVTDALGHRYASQIVAPRCAVGGYTLHVCVCGDSYQTDFTNPRGHLYTAVVTEPGCTTGGYTTYTCDCGDSYRSDYTAPAGHHHEAVVTAPGCTTSGFTTYTCACGNQYVTDFVTALGHGMGQWQTVRAPSCTEAGAERRACSRCDYAEERSLEATGHAYENGICARCGEGEAVKQPFADVPPGSFYEAPVLWAVENGITNGATADTFQPNGRCQRAQVVTFLWRAAGQPEPTSGANPFVDVRETDFYYHAVLWAVENGITNGLDATHFGPFADCNRAQVVTFLYRAMGQPGTGTDSTPFTDVAAGAWYEVPILWAVESGVTNGMGDGTFGVNGVCNRAQVVTFLYRAFA